MKTTVAIFLMVLVPIWIVTVMFRFASVPLKTEVPKKFGTIIVVYGVMIPLAPALLAWWGTAVRLRSIFFYAFGNASIGTKLNLLAWSKFFALYWFMTAIFAVGLAALVGASLHSKNCFSRLVIHVFDRLDIIDETQVLLFQNKGPLQVDVLQGNYVYSGAADQGSLSDLFGTKSLILKKVVRVEAQQTGQDGNLAKAKKPSVVLLEEVVFPVAKITNYNLRKSTVRSSNALAGLKAASR